MAVTDLFPFFNAPLEEASEYRGPGRCTLCRSDVDAIFELGIGADLIAACPGCGHSEALDAESRLPASCTQCAAEVPFPNLAADLFACAGCLKARKAALTKDTELGMVRWVDAVAGWTHGLPGFSSTEWPTSQPDEEGWVKVQVPEGVLFDLLSTPTYSTIQGDRWLFCCHVPMTYVGAWSRARFNEEAPDGDGRALFQKVVEGSMPGLWEDELHDVTGVYVFECQRCNRRRAHWDVG
jgi:uncharacterized protein CbrC (UPF0167 family)